MNNNDEYHADRVYLTLMRQILEHGTDTPDRTGVGTRTVFGTQMRFPLALGFPLLTTKKVAVRSIFAELCWFIGGGTNIRPLLQQRCSIWTEWPFSHYLRAAGREKEVPRYSAAWDAEIAKFADRILHEDEFAKNWGELGPVYGKQWRRWENARGQLTDQIANVVRDIREDPASRRLIVCAWNPGETDEMCVSGLPPCHCLFQFKVIGGKLSCQLYQRSADFFLGVPFNIASYAALTHVVARATELEVGDFILAAGDTHLYRNHFEQAALQLSREDELLPMPTLAFAPDAPIDAFALRPEHLIIEGYQSHPTIKAPIAV